MNAIVLINFHCPYEYACECLESVLKQERVGEVKIFVYDDGSKLDADSGRFMVLLKECNAYYMCSDVRGGPAKARFCLWNKVIEETTKEFREGAFTMLIDGDDYLLTDAVFKLYNEEFEKGAKFVFGAMQGVRLKEYTREVWENTESRRAIWNCTCPRAFCSTLHDEVVLHHAMFRYGGEWLKFSTDRAIMYELIERSAATFDEVAYVRNVVYYYRGHEGSSKGGRFFKSRKRKIHRWIVIKGGTDYYRKGKWKKHREANV